MEQLVESISRIPQLIVYGIISGSILTLGAVGLSLTYSILNFANFAHGDIMALGAFFALASLTFLRWLGVSAKPFGPLSFGFPMVIAFIIAILLTAVTAIIIDRILYKKLRKTGRIILLVASVGVALSLRNIIQFIWGPDPQYYFKKIQIAKKIFGIRIKPDEILIIGVAFLFVFVFDQFLGYN